MIGKCESCGTSNIEVIPSKENGKEKLLCNQCRPADGAYGYWLVIDWLSLIHKLIYQQFSLIFLFIS